MNRMITVVAAVAVYAVCSVRADYSVRDEGVWPKSWPAELEPLRKQSRTLVGPLVEQRHYAIRFSKREEFEAAWPHLLKAKTEGAPVFLLHGPSFFLGGENKAGVVFHSPPAGQADNPATPEAPIPAATDFRIRWRNATYIELVVDGDVVDLNRIPLPADTPIIDERFKDAKE